jgi:hypothetical protein
LLRKSAVFGKRTLHSSWSLRNSLNWLKKAIFSSSLPRSIKNFARPSAILVTSRPPILFIAGEIKETMPAPDAGSNKFFKKGFLFKSAVSTSKFYRRLFPGHS